MTTLEGINLGLGMLGTTLGIISTTYNLSTRRVRLRVIPKMALRGASGIFSHKSEMIRDGVPAIEVINLSTFAVTISEAGFTLDGETSRVTATPPFISDNKPWPRRLDARESVTVFFSTANLPKNLGKAYAHTDCGEARYGSSPAFQKFKHHLNSE